MPLMSRDPITSSNELIRQLAAQAPKPYGAIPPLLKKRKKKNKHHRSPSNNDKARIQQRMSHVENWIVVDSKESLPDEEELVDPFSTFLSADFFTQVLPLHMPPPSLSDPRTTPTGPIMVHSLSHNINDNGYEDEEEDEDEDEEDDSLRATGSSVHDGEDEGETEGIAIVHRHSITSYSKSQTPSTSTTSSCVLSTSPPREDNDMRWVETLAKLKRSLVTPKKPLPPPHRLIPMPPPPRRPPLQRRRSEATTQPRFNPETNTYLRDTRSNPDHLRIIVAELNMIRHLKLLSPLKPRGFLTRRKDPFVKGTHRRESPLQNECIFE
ncbi:hypothetical protein K492DRAFT_177256 [Lichtheimia hyalospora FSU 10163]|nr:hypothetical protein K492DRAFT_177256 [Lichtheimia hyalospora FSU 10163]